MKFNRKLVFSAAAIITMTLAGCSNTTPHGKYVDGIHEVSAKGKKSIITLTVEV